MKNHALKLLLLTLLSALVLSACGGGGGGGGSPASQTLTYTAPDDPDAFSLVPLKSLNTYANLSFPSMTGKDTDENQYTASLLITYDPTVLGFNGKSVTSIQSKVTLTNTTAEPDITSTSTGTSYYEAGYVLAATTLGDPATVTCLPDPGSFQAPPNEATDGSQGTLVDLTCNDAAAPNNTTINITWRLERVSADEAKFIITESSYVNNVADATQVDRYIINRGGYVKRIEVSTTKAGVITNLSGDRL